MGRRAKIIFWVAVTVFSGISVIGIAAMWVRWDEIKNIELSAEKVLYPLLAIAVVAKYIFG